MNKCGVALACITLASLALALGAAPLRAQGAFLAPLRPTQSRFSPVAERGTERRGARGMSMMGGKVAKFGIFSPAVIAAKIILGETKLNKIRGKAIALHSQAITEFCYFVGAQGKMRNRIIKKAKTNGDELGFLW
jgi:hypothetical protein